MFNMTINIEKIIIELNNNKHAFLTTTRGDVIGSVIYNNVIISNNSKKGILFYIDDICCLKIYNDSIIGYNNNKCQLYIKTM